MRECEAHEGIAGCGVDVELLCDSGEVLRVEVEVVQPGVADAVLYESNVGFVTEGFLWIGDVGGALFDGVLEELG